MTDEPTKTIPDTAGERLLTAESAATPHRSAVTVLADILAALAKNEVPIDLIGEGYDVLRRERHSHAAPERTGQDTQTPMETENYIKHGLREEDIP